jgi:hypothetical protein
MLTNALAMTCLLNCFYDINEMFRLDILTTSTEQLYYLIMLRRDTYLAIFLIT